MVDVRISAVTKMVTVNGVAVSSDPSSVAIARRAAMECTPRQARLAMVQTNYGEGSLLEAVQAAVDSSPNSAVKITWEYATKWQRADAFISSIGAQLGLTEEDIDDLFLLAMQL